VKVQGIPGRRFLIKVRGRNLDYFFRRERCPRSCKQLESWRGGREYWAACKAEIRGCSASGIS